MDRISQDGPEYINPDFFLDFKGNVVRGPVVLSTIWSDWSNAVRNFIGPALQLWRYGCYAQWRAPLYKIACVSSESSYPQLLLSCPTTPLPNQRKCASRTRTPSILHHHSRPLLSHSLRQPYLRRRGWSHRHPRHDRYHMFHPIHLQSPSCLLRDTWGLCARTPTWICPV